LTVCGGWRCRWGVRWRIRPAAGKGQDFLRCRASNYLKMKSRKRLLGGNSPQVAGKIGRPQENSRPTIQVQELELPGAGLTETEEPVEPTSEPTLECEIDGIEGKTETAIQKPEVKPNRAASARFSRASPLRSCALSTRRSKRIGAGAAPRADVRRSKWWSTGVGRALIAADRDPRWNDPDR